mmetsp:Transcript_9227/g.16979  ORF Transcript_9227/g.16979 Transcript_9227/m.16979 type:complete len:209 (-) Transcript_9227:50-676(-)
MATVPAGHAAPLQLPLHDVKEQPRSPLSGSSPLSRLSPFSPASPMSPFVRLCGLQPSPVSPAPARSLRAATKAGELMVRLPGCISPTLLSPSSRGASPVSPTSPGKVIRRNAALLGIPLDLRGAQVSLPVPVRTITGAIMAPSPTAPDPRTMQRPSFGTVSAMPAGSVGGLGSRLFGAPGRPVPEAGRPHNAEHAGPAPLRKVVRGGA